MADMSNEILERDRGREAAAKGVPKQWKLDFIAAAEIIATNQEFMTCDDVWDAGVPKPVGDPRAAGQMMLSLARFGIIEKTGRYINSSRRHAGTIAVWKSLVYDGS